MPMLALLAMALISSVTAAATSSSASSPTVDDVTWSSWRAEHGKSYSAAEEAQKRSTFARNLQLFAARTRHDTATYGADEHADLTVEEFVAARAGCFSDEGFDQIPKAGSLLAAAAAGAPPSVDWRTAALNPAKVVGVTKVKNQGAYGYCWAFGASGCLEGMNAIQQKNPLVELSEQEFIDCCTDVVPTPAQSCWGHGPQATWNFLLNYTHGTDSTEASYPYNLHARKGDNNMTCALKSRGGTGITVNGTTVVKSKAKIGSYVSASTDKATGNQDVILAALIKYGPGNIGVDATCLFGYKKGIISNCTGKSVDHATLLVGAGSAAGLLASDGSGAAMPYWIVKNSWGPTYGEGGYYRMERNHGQCDFDGAAFPIAAADAEVGSTRAVAADADAGAGSAYVYDDFTTYNSSTWSYADGSMGKTDGSKTWYLKNHSQVDATLSLQEGNGLRMLMSSHPCKSNPAACGGAKMAADHLTSTSSHLYGDYELRMRAPYVDTAPDGEEGASTGSSCPDGIYAYFTAGYVNKDSKWNELNFGFHPDRDKNGTAVSCEHHDDTGGYHETTVELGFNYRESFNTFVIQARKGSITWLVRHGGSSAPLKKLHAVKATLTEPMTTRLILRTNFRNGDPGSMPQAVFEMSHFKFSPVP